MSSTNRSSQRHISDYYVTPISEIYKVLNFLGYFFGSHIFSTRKFLDPCAGGDVNNKMSYPEALKNFSVPIETIDIRLDSLANIKEDYLKINCKDKYGIIITNPPFNIAEDIIKKALDDITGNGLVIMLLRLNFFGSMKRKNFWDSNMPIYTLMHRKRMSFTPSGGTDSIEYMHCIWEKARRKEYTKLFII